MNTSTPLRARRREWIGLAVVALPCLVDPNGIGVDVAQRMCP